MVSETTFTSGNLTERENTKNDNIFYGLWGDILSIANINAGREESFETKLGKKLTFPQPTPYTSCLCEICENSSLLAKGLNSRMKFSENSF